MHTRFLRLVITLVFALLSVALSKGQGAPVFHLEKEIPLTGVEGRIDHFSADVAGQRLFVAALENGSVEVLDVREGKRTAEIRGLKEPQGVLYILFGACSPHKKHFKLSFALYSLDQ